MAEERTASARYDTVQTHLRAVHEPAFGRPSALREPHVSRDGRRTVVTAEVLTELDGLPRTALYTAEDGRLRQVSASSNSARSGRFSPGGHTLAFLADRAERGVFQLHLLADGRLGEAEPAPPVPGTIEYLHWSPDGERILLGVAGLGAELSGGQGSGVNRSSTDEAPPWSPRVDSDVTQEAWRSLWTYTPATGALARLSPEGLNCWESGWCGPEHVAAITSDAPGEDSWYGADLSLIDLHGAARKMLSSDVQLGLPTGSPDGTWLSVAEAVCSDRWLVAGDLLLVDPASGAVRRIDTRGTDVTRLEWIDDTRLGFIGQRHLDSVAGIVRVDDGSVSEVFSTSLACGGSTFHPDGAFTDDGRVCTIQESYELPQQLVLTGPDGDRVLASIAHPGTDHLRSVAGTAEAVTWTAPDGTEIEGILCTPEGAGPFPLVVNIHGGPIWAFRNCWSMKYQWVPLLVSRGYAVLNPNPRGSCGRGQEFASLVVGDMGGADTHDYLSGIDALVERGIVDESRVGLIGGSYGGYMSSWLVTQDRRIAAAVPISPVTNWYSQSFTSNIAAWGNRFLDADPERHGTRAHTRSPVLHASKARTPCLNVAGALDNCTPPGQAQEFHQALRAHGVPSTLVIYPQEGHGVRAYPAQIDFLARMLDWFEHYMPAEEPVRTEPARSMPRASPGTGDIEYPSTRRGEDVDELAGVRSPDPYRWLEDDAADDVRLWQREQSKLASETVRSWPGFDALRELVDGHTAPRFGSAPRFAGGRWFRSATAEGASQAGVVAADEPYGDGDTVYSPEPDGEGAAPFLSWFAPSPDGRILAVGLCDDGSEQNSIRLLDLRTRAWLDTPPTQRLMDGWSGGVHWLPDSSGFFFTGLLGDPADASYQVWFHRVADATTTRQEVPWRAAASEYRMVLPDRSGTRAVAIERLLTPCPVAIADLDTAGNATWRPFVDGTDATVAGHLVGDRFIAVTDLDADRGRLVAIDPDRPQPEDWVTLVPESDAVLRTLTVVGDLLYVSEFVDTYARVQIYDRSGTHLGEVPLPGRGAIGEHPYPYPNLVPRGHPEEFWFAFSTLTSSWGTYRHRPGATEVEELQAPAVTVADAVVEDHWATSTDGTRVPYHLVRRRDLDPTAPQPSLLYAYGGYNAPLVPQYPGGQAALVAAGAVFVHTHLRGGSEFGHAWWLGGRKQTKQNCYDDLYAVAEDLIDKGRTSPGQLGVTGGSNGGLMAGVAVTQRPDLWAAVVPRAPLLDLVGACREPYGRYAVAVELADIDDPADVARMLALSPYQLVEERTYPAVYLDAGDTDPRCSPWHARKFAAALQEAQQGDAPILLRVWENVGHGWATAADVALEQSTEFLAFVCRQLDIDPTR